MNFVGPFAESQSNAFKFITNLVVNAAVSETLKVMDDMNAEGKRLIKDIKASAFA
jgi:hypothetical protein